MLQAISKCLMLTENGLPVSYELIHNMMIDQFVANRKLIFVSVERASNKEEHFLEQSRAFLGEEKTKLQKQTHGMTRLMMLNTMMSLAVRFGLPEAETTILLSFQFS